MDGTICSIWKLATPQSDGTRGDATFFLVTVLEIAIRATVFLLDDTQLINEAFLEDVNGILNTGEVPSLFNNEEMVAINEALTKPAQVWQSFTRFHWGPTLLNKCCLLSFSPSIHYERRALTFVKTRPIASLQPDSKPILRISALMLWCRAGRGHQHGIPWRGVRLLH